MMTSSMRGRSRFGIAWALLALGASALGCSERAVPADIATDSAAFTEGPALSPSWKFDGDEDGDEDEVASGFGREVAFADVNGDGHADLVVGAANWGSNDRGAAFLIEGSSSGLAAVWSWKVQGASGENLGRRVANAGDVNGDGFEDVAVAGQRANGRGFVSVFHGSASGLSTTAAWSRTGTQDGSPTGSYGFAIASAGDVNDDGYDELMIGARYESRFPNDPLPDYKGAAYVHFGGSSGLAFEPSWTRFGDQLGVEELGHSVDGAGDVNGDGYDDIVVGSYEESFVYLGAASGIPAQIRARKEIGYAVAGVGDVNGDGYDDVAGVSFGARAANVHLGSASGMSPTAHWTIDFTYFGRSISRAGDVNGDGYDDLIVSSDSNTDQSNEGIVHLFTGSQVGLSQQAAARMEGDIVGVRLGIDLAGGADVTGDGYDDMVAAAFGVYPLPTAEMPSFAAVYEGSASLGIGGSSGSGGTGGTSGSGGASGGGTGGTTGDGGTAGVVATGGSGGAATGGTGGVAGETADAGEAGSDGSAGESGAGSGASGGSGATGGTDGSGAIGGRNSGSGGDGASSGDSSSAGDDGGAGEAGGPGAGAQAGSGGRGSGGNAGSSGAGAGQAGTSGQPGEDGGCGCRIVPQSRSDAGAVAIALLALGAFMRRQRRS
jgi:hypothetical protein